MWMLSTITLQDLVLLVVLSVVLATCKEFGTRAGRALWSAACWAATGAARRLRRRWAWVSDRASKANAWFRDRRARRPARGADGKTGPAGADSADGATGQIWPRVMEKVSAWIATLLG